MTTEWPTRPFHQLPPPHAGAAAVRREARRRRRRTAAASSALTVLVLLGGVALAQQGGPHPTDTLRVTDDPTGAGTPSAAPSVPAPVVTSSPGGPARSGSPSPAPAPLVTSSASPAAGGPRAVGYRTPDLTRVYVDRTPTTPGLTVCSGAENGTGTSLQSTVNWCERAAVTATSRGHDLVAEVCRDASSDATLSFASTHEVELRVLDSAGRTVWAWSAGHPDENAPHVLAVQRNHCWDWTAPWTDVDAQGRALSHGSYQLVVVPRAHELAAAPDAVASFTL